MGQGCTDDVAPQHLTSRAWQTPPSMANAAPCPAIVLPGPRSVGPIPEHDGRRAAGQDQTAAAAIPVGGPPHSGATSRRRAATQPRTTLENVLSGVVFQPPGIGPSIAQRPAPRVPARVNPPQEKADEMAEPVVRRSTGGCCRRARRVFTGQQYGAAAEPERGALQ